MTQKPYRYTRFRWLKKVDINKVAKELGEKFTVEELLTSPPRLSIGYREKIKIKADTLTVRLSPFRAILYQREPERFTEKDMELRKRILELYPRSKSEPYKLGSKEPTIVKTELDEEVKEKSSGQ